MRPRKILCADASQARRCFRKRADSGRPHAGRPDQHRPDRQEIRPRRLLKGTAENFRLAKKSKALDRALKQAVPPEIYDQLEREFISVEEQFLAAKAQEDDEDGE